jgi:organic hydroperoxide reductase OsmC/OhrA
LHPTITITAQSSLDTARRLHHDAHEKCFIANSVNFPVRVQPEFHPA